MTHRRIAILGNCQANTLCRIFGVVAPSIEVVRFDFNELVARFATREDLFAELACFDTVFTQPFGRGFLPDLDGAILKERFGRSLYFYPTIEFNAFHPDCVYICRRSPREVLHSPIGDYHSAIVFLGWSLGLTLGRILALFDAEIFERLGYFRYWDVSEEMLLKQCRLIEFPVGRMYRTWVRRGSFMHSVNHPKLFVLVDVALTLLELAGVAVVRVPIEDYLPDGGLIDSVWPIYPEIGDRMGLKGAYYFKGGARLEDPIPLLTLPEFVERSVEFYRREQPGALESSRVEEWMKDAPLVDDVLRRVCA